MLGFARMAAQALMNGLFGKCISLVVDHIWGNAPEWLHLGRYNVVVEYEEGGETKTQHARFPNAWMANQYVTSLKRRWGEKKPRCIVKASPGMENGEKLPLHQPRRFLGFCIAC